MDKKEAQKQTILRHKPTFGERAADSLTKFIGSWFFIFVLLSFLCIWILINIYGWINGWDPYPFILLNLTLSCLATIQAAIILMSQNREEQKTKIRQEYDYRVDKKAEREIQEIKKQLDKIERKL